MIFRQKLLLFSTLLALTQQQETAKLTSDTTTQSITYVILIILVISLLFFILYDRRQNYYYVHLLRNIIQRKWDALVSKIRQIKGAQQNSLKLGTEQQISTDKGTVGFMQSQKTYIEADLASIQQTANTSSSLPDQFKEMSFEDQTPKKSLKQVFDKKQKKEGKKSRSKLKNKVQIKKSELQQCEVEQPNSERNQDLQNSLEANEV